jgi:hypothetical protein
MRSDAERGRPTGTGLATEMWTSGTPASGSDAPAVRFPRLSAQRGDG